MIKNRRILLLSNILSEDVNQPEWRMAEELHTMGNEVFLLQGISSTMKLKSSFNVKEIESGFSILSIEVGLADALSQYLGFGNPAERLAAEMVFELGKLFDVVLSFHSKDFVDLSVFYAKVNLLFLKSNVDRDFINSSVDQVVVLNTTSVSLDLIWLRISEGSDTPNFEKVLDQAS